MSIFAHLFDGSLEEEQTKTCQKCKVEKPFSAFAKESGNKVRSQCRVCDKHVGQVRGRLKKVVAKPAEDYTCPVCGDNGDQIQARTRYKNKTYTPWSLDHDHDTGEFRAWLCNKCNLGLGNFKDDPEMLQKGIDYLNRFKK